MLLLAAMAIVAGTGGALGAWALLKLIALATNIFWFGRFSATPSDTTDAALGPAMVAIPIIGSLIVGLMARYGSEKIRGHGIPEAIEATRQATRNYAKRQLTWFRNQTPDWARA